MTKVTHLLSYSLLTFDFVDFWGISQIGEVKR